MFFFLFSLSSHGHSKFEVSFANGDGLVRTKHTKQAALINLSENIYGHVVFVAIIRLARPWWLFIIIRIRKHDLRMPKTINLHILCVHMISYINTNSLCNLTWHEKSTQLTIAFIQISGKPWQRGSSLWAFKYWPNKAHRGLDWVGLASNTKGQTHYEFRLSTPPHTTHPLGTKSVN